MHRLELKIPPLVVLVFVAGLMWFGSRAAPGLNFEIAGRRAIALGISAIGVGFAVAGVVSFRLATTTVNPMKPEAASALVVSGVYRLTRNPMYLGALIVLIGWAAYLANTLGFVLAPLFVLYMNRFQIGPEERALELLFGSEFAVYRTKVRRWL